jgi:hypothetical protein
MIRGVVAFSMEDNRVRTLTAILLCPATGQPLEITLERNDGALCTRWSSQINVACPTCDEVHGITYGRLYAASALADLRCQPVDAASERLFH